tara:strand:+ start:931 stop:1203 length:273 start_codon:yes stop_codon:yes gene_type:complete
MHIEGNKIYQLRRRWTDRWNDVKVETTNFTTMKKASEALMRGLIGLAKKNIRTATQVKGAIRGNGVQTISNLQEEVENHGYSITTLVIRD